MAASTPVPTLSTHFIMTFRPEVRGDAQAIETIFSQTNIGRPFFYACEDPNMIGFIYTDKRGLTTQKHLYVKSHFTGEVVSVDMLHRLGVPRPFTPTTDTLPHLIASCWLQTFKPMTRPSSDPDAISLTFTQADGTRGDLRLHFFMGENHAPIQVKAADLTHVYNSSYDRYYWNPVALTEPNADPIP